MAIYKFRVIYEDDTDCIRDIEIKSTQSFEVFHYAILDAVNFQPTELASFYLSDDNWRKGKEIALMDMSDDMEGPLAEAAEPPLVMNKCLLEDYVEDPHQKFIYVFDFINLWNFQVELIKIIPSEDPKAIYPRCVKQDGPAPRQFKNNNHVISPDDEDDDQPRKKGARGTFAELGGVEEFGDDDEFGDSEEGEEDDMGGDFDEFSGGQEFGQDDDRY